MLFINKGIYISKKVKTGNYKNKQWKRTEITYVDEDDREHKITTFNHVPEKNTGDNITVYVYKDKKKNIYEVCKVE